METNYLIELAKPNDLEQIMKVIDDARQLLKTQNSGQWQDGTPSENTIRQDILNKAFYVLKEGIKILAVMAVLDYEKDYDQLQSGSWQVAGSYFVIHRFAVTSSARQKGIASKMLQFVEYLAHEKQQAAVRIDTHEKNIPMINLLKKNGYRAVGVAILEGNKVRIAFEKPIQ